MNKSTLSGDQLKDKIANQLANTSFAGTASIQDVAQQTPVGDKRADITATITTASGVQIPVIVEVKNTQRLSSVREMIRQTKQLARLVQAEPMIAGVFWGDRTRRLAKEEGVGLVDLAGNFLIQKDPIFIEKIVTKNPFSKATPLKTLFSQVSTRIIRAVLIEPKRVWNVPELSEVTNVSIGQTYKVVDRLVAEELGQRNKVKQFTLTSPTELLNAWRKVYTKDKNQQFVFYSFEKDQDKLADKVREISKNDRLDYALGYFSGALKVAPFIRGFNKVQFFARSSEDLEQYKKKLELSPVESGGNVEIFLPYDEGVFYKLQKVDEVKIVNNIQLYIDLINHPGRGKEQAQHLRERVIKF